MKNNNKKVYVVASYNDGIYGVYTTKEKAEKAREKADYHASMSGSHGFYYIEEAELDKEG